MTAFVDWEYYSSLFSDPAVPETDFPAAEKLAEMTVRSVIGPIRWAELKSLENIDDEFFYEPLLDCICRVIEYSATTGSRTGLGVTSVSNDGYTESYAADLVKASEATEELNRNIRLWLSGTGLVRAY